MRCCCKSVFGVWVPAVFFFAYAELSGRKWGVVLAQCLTALQPILTTCLILTKSDAKKYIWDLVTLSYIFGDSFCNRTCNEKDKRRPIERSKNSSHTSERIESVDEYDKEAEYIIFSVLGSRSLFSEIQTDMDPVEEAAVAIGDTTDENITHHDGNDLETPQSNPDETGTTMLSTTITKEVVV